MQESKRWFSCALFHRGVLCSMTLDRKSLSTNLNIHQWSKWMKYYTIAEVLYIILLDLNPYQSHFPYPHCWQIASETVYIGYIGMKLWGNYPQDWMARWLCYSTYEIKQLLYLYLYTYRTCISYTCISNLHIKIVHKKYTCRCDTCITLYMYFGKMDHIYMRRHRHKGT